MFFATGWCAPTSRDLIRIPCWIDRLQAWSDSNDWFRRFFCPLRRWSLSGEAGFGQRNDCLLNSRLLRQGKDFIFRVLVARFTISMQLTSEHMFKVNSEENKATKVVFPLQQALLHIKACDILLFVVTITGLWWQVGSYECAHNNSHFFHLVEMNATWFLGLLIKRALSISTFRTTRCVCVCRLFSD